MLSEPVAVEQVFLHKNMSNEQAIIDSNLRKEYQYGFVTDIDSDTLPADNVIHGGMFSVQHRYKVFIFLVLSHISICNNAPALRCALALPREL